MKQGEAVPSDAGDNADACKPQRISSSWSEWQGKVNPQQAVVVGSGYGGSVAALRLAEQGWQVTVLERGGEFLPGQFPNDFSHALPAFRLPSMDGKSVLGSASGLWEFRAGPGAAALVGNGVGGGSLINAGVLMRPDVDVFAQEAWPAAIRHAGEDLDDWFNLAKGYLGSECTENLQTTKSDAFERFAEHIDDSPGARAVDVTIGLDRCTGCGDCATGCNVAGAKKTLRDTYLRQAHATRAVTVVSGASVYWIAPGDDREQPESWRLRVIPTATIANFETLRDAAQLESNHGSGVDIEASLVVLSAGTFGSVEILQRSRARLGHALPVSTALGSRFSGNGDAFSTSVNEPSAVHAIGIGADCWRSPAKDRYQCVGPTITRMIDLRGRDCPGHECEPALERRPLHERIVIEEGAMPGAFGNSFAMLLQTCFTALQLGEPGWRENRDAADHLGSGRPGQINRCGQARSEWPLALAERSQLLLSMGHDQSTGMLLWREERDACVPYVEDPGKLDTYRYQERVLTRACKRTGSMWVPAPTWRILPQAMSSVLNGPAFPQLLMTVHPLGGCVMGDDAESSVVDACGRLRIRDSSDVFQNLYVLDGSIVPTSLGCNPLWTITALAERALADSDARGARDALQLRVPAAANPACDGQVPDLVARAPVREAAPVLPVYMEERLVCQALNLPSGTAPRLQDRTADLEFKLHADDWMALWDSANHQLRVEGRMRIDQGAGNPPITYDVVNDQDPPQSTAQLLVADRGHFISRCFRFVRTILSWWILRGREVSACEFIRQRGWCGTFTYACSMRRYFWQATEARHMHYRLALETSAENVPQRLYLAGSKHIQYAASREELFDYIRRWARRGFRRGSTRPLLRATFLEQASNLAVALADTPPQAGSQGNTTSLFSIDYAPMIEKLPMRLKGAGDLPNALVALAEYPGLLIRYLLKTRVFDFRLPNYSGIPVPDIAAAEETCLDEEGKINPDDPIHFTVPLGLSSSDAPGTARDQKIELTLWRYRRPGGKPECKKAKWHGKDICKAKSVLLVHAFAQSGYSYTLNKIENPAHRLYAEGFEVWILEHRLSTRLAAHRQQTTVDQIARYDIPQAVDLIIGQLREDLKEGLRKDGKSDIPLQIFAFAQCVGAAATSMALLSGTLSHEGESVTVKKGFPPQEMPKLAGLFISQTHPHTIGQPLTQAKTWLPAALRDTFGIDTIPFAVRNGTPTAFKENLGDRLFAALPLPAEEECPLHRRDNGKPDHEDDAATCRRIRFLEAPLFKHANVNEQTHRQIMLWFGDANIRTFAHAAKWVEAERLVTEDGDNAYVTDLAYHRYAALPICYLHGAGNELFHFEGAIRSARHYARLQPGWAARVAGALEPAVKNRAANGKTGNWRQLEKACHLVDGYGHVDVLVGQDAAEHIFQPVADALLAWYNDSASPAVPGYEHIFARAHLPATGPLIGAVKPTGVSVSFRIDDRFGDGKEDTTPGSRTWAFALYRDSAGDHLYRLRIENVNSPFRSDTGPDGDTAAFRIACGEIEPPELSGGNLRIECFSVHEVMIAEQIEDPGSARQVDPAMLDSADSSADSIGQLRELLRATEALLAGFANDDGPKRRTVSRLRHYPESPECRYATIPGRSLEVLGKDGAGAKITFAAASCRYPGFRIEHRRVDRWLDLANEWRSGLDDDDKWRGDPDFAILLGDQIYADATGGFADPLNPTERFFQRYRYAFARSHSRSSSGQDWFGDWLARLPVIMTPDDHEFHDGFPDGPPIVKAAPAILAALRQPWVAPPGAALRQPWEAAARDALYFHQQKQLGPYRETMGVWQFRAGAARVMIIDTRSHRSRRVTGRPILSNAQMQALEAWLQDPDANKRLSIIATGSVLLPGKRANSNPENPSQEDNFQIHDPSRNAIFRALQAASEIHDRFRFLLLSGDYHLSAQAVVRAGERNVGACIVAPPLYSPMPFANSAPESLWFEETTCNGWRLAESGVQPGCALGIISVEPVDGKYEIRMSGKTWDPFVHRPGDEEGEIEWKCRL